MYKEADPEEKDETGRIVRELLSEEDLNSRGRGAWLKES